MRDPIDIAEGYSAEPYGDGYIICHSGGGRAVAQLDMAAAVREIARLREELALCCQLKREYQERAALAAQVPQPAAPTIEAAHDMGAKGGPAMEAERLAFEAWMRGHCWALCAKWTGAQYLSDGEQDGWPDPQAMATRRLWAAWRDRAALAVPAGMVLVPVELTEVMQLAGALAHQQSVCHDFMGPIADAWAAMLAASQESATTRGRG